MCVCKKIQNLWIGLVIRMIALIGWNIFLRIDDERIKIREGGNKIDVGNFVSDTFDPRFNNIFPISTFISFTSLCFPSYSPVCWKIGKYYLHTNSILHLRYAFQHGPLAIHRRLVFST